MAGKYTRVAVLLHWLIAFGIVANVLIIWTLDAWPESWTRPLINTHKSIGLTVLGLGLMRVLWRATHAPPAMPASYKPWEVRAAHLAHWSLYGLIFALPLSGYFHDSAWKAAAEHPLKLFGLVAVPRLGWIATQPAAAKEHLHDLFGLAHAVCAYGLYVLYVLHVGGALKHQFVDKERELQRMLP